MEQGVSARRLHLGPGWSGPFALGTGARRRTGCTTLFSSPGSFAPGRIGTVGPAMRCFMRMRSIGWSGTTAGFLGRSGARCVRNWRWGRVVPGVTPSGGVLLGLPQIRTCGFAASGSSGHGFTTHGDTQPRGHGKTSFWRS